MPDPFDTEDRLRIERDTNAALVREILEALCRRDGLSLDSSVTPGEPARNYELALRLGIGQVFDLTLAPDEYREVMES